MEASRSCGDWADLHVVAHLAQPTDQVACGTVGVELVEITGAHVLVITAVGEHVVCGHQDLVTDGDGRRKGASARLQAAVLFGPFGAPCLACGLPCPPPRDPALHLPSPL